MDLFFLYLKCFVKFTISVKITIIIYPNLRRCDTRSPSKLRSNEGEGAHKRKKKYRNIYIYAVFLWCWFFSDIIWKTFNISNKQI